MSKQLRCPEDLRPPRLLACGQRAVAITPGWGIAALDRGTGAPARSPSSLTASRARPDNAAMPANGRPPRQNRRTASFWRPQRHPETGSRTAGVPRRRPRRRCGPGRRRSRNVLPGSRDGGRRRTDRADQRSSRTDVRLRAAGDRRSAARDAPARATPDRSRAPPPRLLQRPPRATHGIRPRAHRSPQGRDRVSRGDQPELRRERAGPPGPRLRHRHHAPQERGAAPSRGVPGDAGVRGPDTWRKICFRAWFRLCARASAGISGSSGAWTATSSGTRRDGIGRSWTRGSSTKSVARRCCHAGWGWPAGSGRPARRAG